MSGEPVWTCVRQRAGPLVKECRSIRPRLSANDTIYERTEKNKILRPPRDASVCRTRVDRLELRLALEARRQGVSYGRLVANTDRWDLKEIIRAYCAKKKRKGKRREKAETVAGQ